MSHSLNGSGQSSASFGTDDTSYGSDIQSVHNGNIVDVLVGVGGLLLEILVAGDDLGEVDLSRDDGEPEAEAGKYV